MAVLTHDRQYPCIFELTLQSWERYSADAEAFDGKPTGLGKPYTLWVTYRMALRMGETILYGSKKDTTLVLEDISRLIDGLGQVSAGKKERMGFDPIEPDFGLSMRRITKSDATVMISSAAEIRAQMPTGAVNPSSELVDLFEVCVWIDYPNQVDRFYGGYGPGFVFLCGIF